MYFINHALKTKFHVLNIYIMIIDVRFHIFNLFTR